MKKQTGNKIRLGILISTSVVLLIIGIYFVGQRQQLFNSTFHVSGIFNDISGLQVGNNVRFSGINVGIVESIQQITDTSVSVVMAINTNTKKFIKKNATAIIGSDGLMGNKIVSIVSGKPGKPELSDNDIIETAIPVSIDDILVKLKVTADNAADITDDLAFITGNIREGRGTVGKLLMDSSFARNIDNTIVNLKQSTIGLKQNMDAASHNFLLRGYFKKMKKEKDKKENDAK